MHTFVFECMQVTALVSAVRYKHTSIVAEMLHYRCVYV